MTTSQLETILSEEGTNTSTDTPLSTEEKRKFIVAFYTPDAPARATLFIGPQTYQKLFALEMPVSVESIAQLVKENSIKDANPVVLNTNGVFKLGVTEEESYEEFKSRVNITYEEMLLLEHKEKVSRLAQYERLKLEFSKGEIV